MRLLFVTGANAAFFPTLMVLLASFGKQLGGERLLVCDYGLAPGEREFLRRRGALLDRPPSPPEPIIPLREKTRLHSYLATGAVDPAAFDAVVWLDADLTITSLSPAEIAAAARETALQNADIAASPLGTIAELLDFFRGRGLDGAPFERLLAQHGVDRARTYYSSGIFICRSPGFLSDWMELGESTRNHPLLDQNLFNVLLHGRGRPVVALDCEQWQTQGRSLESVRVVPSPEDGAQRLWIGERTVKTLHATSDSQRHLFIGTAILSVEDLTLEGAFKLLRPQALLGLQLDLLARFVAAHRAELLELGICRRAAQPIAGYSFRAHGPK